MTGLAALTVLSGSIVIIGAALMLWFAMKKEANSFTITEEEVHIEGLPQAFEGTRLFFISDLHRRLFTREQLQMAQRHGAPELVLLGGDVTEQGVSIDQVVANISNLRELAPVIMVHGNHDHKCNTRELDTALMEAGVRMLDHTSMRCEKAGATLWLCGMDDKSSGHTNSKWTFEQSDLEPHCAIVLAHDPAVIGENIPPYVKLILTGHTHGGQINLPLYGALRTSSFYRRYLSGWFTIESKHYPGNAFKLFVSNGFGTSHVSLRWNAPPQAHFITLRCSP